MKEINIKDANKILKYLKICFFQATNLSDNDNIYNDNDGTMVSVKEVADLIKRLENEALKIGDSVDTGKLFGLMKVVKIRANENRVDMEKGSTSLSIDLDKIETIVSGVYVYKP